MIEITDEPLDPEEITAKVRRDSNGAVVTFLGTTRDFTAGRTVLHLEYEAYRPMADSKLAEIVDEIRERWSIEDVAIAHRLGRLEIGDTSLMVMAGLLIADELSDANQELVDVRRGNEADYAGKISALAEQIELLADKLSAE